MAKTILIIFRTTPEKTEEIDAWVKGGYYLSRSDFLRKAVETELASPKLEKLNGAPDGTSRKRIKRRIKK